MSVKPRKRMKAGLSASIDARTLVKLEDISINRRAKFSPIVQEILDLGIEYYEKREEDRTFKRDLEEVKRMEAVRRAALEGGS